MHRGSWKSSSPRIAGVQWSSTVGRTVGYGAGRGSRPGHCPWSCGDRAGVLAAPAGGVVVAVEGNVLQAWRGEVPRVLQARVLSMPFEGSAEGKV